MDIRIYTRIYFSELLCFRTIFKKKKNKNVTALKIESRIWIFFKSNLKVCTLTSGHQPVCQKEHGLKIQGAVREKVSAREGGVRGVGAATPR